MARIAIAGATGLRNEVANRLLGVVGELRAPVGFLSPRCSGRPAGSKAPPGLGRELAGDRATDVAEVPDACMLRVRQLA